MGRNIKIPKRIRSEKIELTDLQMVFLDCFILGIGKPKVIFRLLLTPSNSEKESLSMMQSLLKNSDAKDYMEKRKAQIEEFFFGNGEDKEDSPKMSEDDIRRLIFNKLSDNIVQSIEDNTLDYKQGDIITKFMIKALDYDDKEVNAPSPPMVYLPENCGNCRYKFACENQNLVIDECKVCRYRQDDLDRGIEYNYKEQLKLNELCQ